MKLVCVSHPCVVPANQELFARVRSLTGWELTIVVPSRWRNELGDFRPERSPTFDGALVPLPVLGSGKVPLHVYRVALGRVIRRERPAAVYVHNEPYALATVQALRATPRGVAAGFYSAQNLAKRYPPPFRALELATYRRASFALPVSDAVLQVLRAKGYAGPAEVLPLAVDVSAAPERPRSRDGFTVGFLGRLVPEKGVDVLLEALGVLPQWICAVVVGAGPEEERLRAQAARLGVAERVTWGGYVRHGSTAGILGALDLLVVPSRSVHGWKEQFGRVVIEALACGTPVAASDCGELPRLLGRTGGGWTFPEGDAGALARLIERAAVDEAGRARAAARGRAAVELEFGLDAIATRFAAIVEQAVTRASRPSSSAQVEVAA